LGAALVITSFAVKDDYREEIKSLGDSISAAESTLIIRSESERIYNLVNHTRHPVDIFHPPTASSGGSSAWEILDPNILESDRNEVQQAVVTLDNIARLAEKLPKTRSMRNRVITIETQMKSFEADWDTYEKFKIENHLGALALLKIPKEGLEVYFKLGEKLDAKSNSIVNDIQRLGMDILREAADERVRIEHEYQRWNTLSYVVTFIGAIFTIIGVFLGLEPQEG
jgi:hypothetical protein